MHPQFKPLSTKSFPAPNHKRAHYITWTDTITTAFNERKASLSQAPLPAQLEPPASHALVTDASTTAMGAVLKQRVKDTYQPLAFFPSSLNPVQQKHTRLRAPGSTKQ